MKTACLLAKAGLKVSLIEKEHSISGHLINWSHLFPDLSDPETVIQNISRKMADRIFADTITLLPLIRRMITPIHFKDDDICS